MNLTVGKLKKILEDGNFPDDMLIVTTNHPEYNINAVTGLPFIRTVGVLNCPFENEENVLCIAPALNGADISTLINAKHWTTVSCKKVCF